MRTFVGKIDKIFKSFIKSEKLLFAAGLFLVLAVSIVMIINNRYNVFLVYKFGSLDFWNNINPYSNWQHPYDRYLYGPVFSILFSFFTFLPSWSGALLWNLFCFTLFSYTVFNLPAQRFPFRTKRFVYLYLFPIVLTDLFYFQSNVLVTSVFLLAYTFLEKNKQFYALFLILISGFSKIYGLIQLGTLLFYKRLWRNIIVGIFVSLIFFFLPLIKIPMSELFDYYLSWFNAIAERHTNPADNQNIFRLLNFTGFNNVDKHIKLIQAISLLFIPILTLINRVNFNKFEFRTGVLGIIVMWVILFSTTAEKHTYVIGMAGFVLWYLVSPKTKFDNILLWLNFFIIIVVPIDALVPKAVMRFFYYELGLNLILLTITWLRMVSFTFSGNFISKADQL